MKLNKDKVVSAVKSRFMLLLWGLSLLAIVLIVPLLAHSWIGRGLVLLAGWAEIQGLEKLIARAELPPGIHKQDE